MSGLLTKHACFTVLSDSDANLSYSNCGSPHIEIYSSCRRRIDARINDERARFVLKPGVYNFLAFYSIEMDRIFNGDVLTVIK